MSMTIARERALKGAAWLDQVSPGWDNKVDLLELDLASGEDCVLGQVFAEMAENDWNMEDGYDWATTKFEELHGDGYEYGFDQEFITGTLSRRLSFVVTYEELDWAWTELIEARRAQREAYATYEQNIAAGLRQVALDARDFVNDVVGDLMNDNCVPCPDCAPRIVTVADIARDLVDA